MRFGISTLMFIIFAAAVVCAVALHGSFVAFGLGFMAFMLSLLQLMSRNGTEPVPVRETGTEAEAYLVRDLLVGHGIIARVEQNQMSSMFGGLRGARVVVQPQDEQRAHLVLAELDSDTAQESTADPDPQQHPAACDHDVDD